MSRECCHKTVASLQLRRPKVYKSSANFQLDTVQLGLVDGSSIYVNLFALAYSPTACITWARLPYTFFSEQIIRLGEFYHPKLAPVDITFDILWKKPGHPRMSLSVLFISDENTHQNLVDPPRLATSWVSCKHCSSQQK